MVFAVDVCSGTLVCGDSLTAAAVVSTHVNVDGWLKPQKRKNKSAVRACVFALQRGTQYLADDADVMG